MGVGVLVAAEGDGVAFDVAGGGSSEKGGGRHEEPEMSAVVLEVSKIFPLVPLRAWKRGFLRNYF